MLISSEGISDRYLHLNNCGRQTLSRCDTHTVRPNGRVDYHILYILSGVCHAVVDGKEYAVMPGQIVLFLPRSPQEYSFFRRDMTESVWMHFTGVGCGEYLRELGLCDKAVFDVGKSTELISAVEAMLRTKALGGEENDNSCDGYLYLVLSLMARAASYGEERVRRFSEVSNVADYMSRNYKNTLSVSEYAAMCHLSMSRFEHVFKEYTGTTPLRYTFRIRIKAAMNLLENTGISISQIAEETGFNDANYFTRVFGKYVGMSPMKYRNNSIHRRKNNMEFIREALDTPVKGEYDVIVVGAGPAGCGAALACAKSGLKTIIIDRFNCLGGAWTTGFMNPLFDEKNKGGMMREIVDELKAKSAWGGFWDISFNYEYMKSLLERRMTEAGAEFLFNTYFTRTLCEGDRVIGIVAENIEGRFALRAKYVFDCTGDGSVAASAGCDFEIGEDGDYKDCQAMTLMFLVGNIPEKYRDGLMIFEKLNAAYEKAGKSIPFRMPYLIPVPNTRFGVVQFTHMYEYNPLSAADITAATVEGRRQMIEAFEVLTTYDEEFRNLELIASSSVLGVRESRRIVGEYRLSEEDLLEGRKFEDGLCTVSFNVDIHPKGNQAQDCRKISPYEIPLRCLIPKGKYGILTAGRCISGSHVAHASYRVTGNCFAMGEGAGYAVARAIERGVDVRKV